MFSTEIQRTVVLLAEKNDTRKSNSYVYIYIHIYSYYMIYWKRKTKSQSAEDRGMATPRTPTVNSLGNEGIWRVKKKMVSPKRRWWLVNDLFLIKPFDRVSSSISISCSIDDSLMTCANILGWGQVPLQWRLLGATIEHSYPLTHSMRKRRVKGLLLVWHLKHTCGWGNRGKLTRGCCQRE